MLPCAPLSRKRKPMRNDWTPTELVMLGALICCAAGFVLAVWR